ncbi:MAG: hypothetical protein ACREM6_01265 [Vulcanimicrobiaceae bacterium]
MRDPYPGSMRSQFAQHETEPYHRFNRPFLSSAHRQREVIDATRLPEPAQYRAEVRARWKEVLGPWQQAVANDRVC